MARKSKNADLLAMMREENRDWLHRKADEVKDDWGKLTSCLKKTGQSPVISIYTMLRQRSLGAQGAASIFLGDVSGWQHLQSSWRYLALEGLIAFHLARRGHPFVLPHIQPLAATLMMAEAVRHRSFAQTLYSLLRQGLQDGTFARAVKNGNVWGDNPVFGFIMQAGPLIYGQSPLDPQEVETCSEIKSYREVLEHLQDREMPAECMEVVCELHVKDYRTDMLANVFLSSPADLWPIDVLFVRRIRETLGLPSPTCDHPLLVNNPLLDVPENLPPWEMDEMFQRVLDYVEREIGLSEICPPSLWTASA